MQQRLIPQPPQTQQRDLSGGSTASINPAQSPPVRRLDGGDVNSSLLYDPSDDTFVMKSKSRVKIPKPELAPIINMLMADQIQQIRNEHKAEIDEMNAKIRSLQEELNGLKDYLFPSATHDATYYTSPPISPPRSNNNTTSPSQPTNSLSLISSSYPPPPPHSQSQPLSTSNELLSSSRSNAYTHAQLQQFFQDLPSASATSTSLSTHTTHSTIGNKRLRNNTAASNTYSGSRHVVQRMK